MTLTDRFEETVWTAVPGHNVELYCHHGHSLHGPFSIKRRSNRHT